MWKVFDLESEIAKQKESNRPYREFLRVPRLSAGVYTLPAQAKDLQGPHDEDEMYFVVKGRGRIRIGDEERPVGRGTILYVAASEEHSFFEIEEEITLVVFFASGGPGD